MNKLKTGVYKITNIFNNKIYVGSTSQGFTERKYSHFYNLEKEKHTNKYLQKAFNKYGKNSLKFEIIEKCIPEKCIEREQYWIDKLDSYNNGYNLKPIAGSSLGYKYTKEQRKNISEGLTTKKAVIQLSLGGKFINEYSSISEASKVTGINKKLIINKCKNISSHAAGYNFLYKNEYDKTKDYFIDVKQTTKIKAKIIQKDLNNNIVNIWNSMKQIAQFTNYNLSTVNGCLRNHVKTAYKFKWEYGILG